MIKETTILGLVGIFIGIIAYIKTSHIWASSIPLIFGIVMIFFGKNENKIEERKDE